MEQTMGKRIAQNRKRLGLTQDALAEQLGADIPVFVEHLPDHEAYLAAVRTMREAAEKAGVRCK